MFAYLWNLPLVPLGPNTKSTKWVDSNELPHLALDLCMQSKTWKSLNNAVSWGSILELNNTLSLRSPQSGKYVNTLEETTVANAKIHKKLPQTRSATLKKK